MPAQNHSRFGRDLPLIQISLIFIIFVVSSSLDILELQTLSFVELLDESTKGSFYAEHIFHERQMNSCPIGCEGCAVSAVTNARGVISFSDLYDFYKDAHDQGVSLKITKVEGYDPVFVQYKDSSNIPFAASLKAAVDFGHQIITPLCTTGSWKSARTEWQLEELGKLSNKYRRYTYPSGKTASHFVLSVPREINPFKNGKYDFKEHVNKIVGDIQLLTANGDLEVLIYFNSKTDDDFGVADDIKKAVEKELNETQLERTTLTITDFNYDTLPESCFRYDNSILLCDKGFVEIDKDSKEWLLDPNLTSQKELVKKLMTV